MHGALSRRDVPGRGKAARLEKQLVRVSPKGHGQRRVWMFLQNYL